MKEIPVTFKSHGKQIVGMLHLPNRKNVPLVIICHGWTGNKLGTWNAFFVRLGREFAKTGFAFLRFDFRGSGDSEGKFEDQNTTSMLHDLDTVINQVSKLPEIDESKIGLIGHSQGGRIVLLKASSDKRIKCLVSLAARTDLNYSWGPGWTDDTKIRERVYDSYKVTKKWLKDDLQYNVAKSLRKIKTPLCVVHGDIDYTVPISEAYRIFKYSNKPKKLQIVNGLDHDFTGIKVQRNVAKITLRWFKKWLKLNKQKD